AQPRAELDGTGRLLLSPNGGTPAQLLVHGLQENSSLQMKIKTPDSAIRPCSFVSAAHVSGDVHTWRVVANVPGNTFVCEAQLFVEDAVSGRSIDVGNVFYAPEITVVPPAQGPAEGGTVVTLTGRALTELDFSVSPPQPVFDHVAIQFQKGHRVIDVDPTALRRALSTVD